MIGYRIMAQNKNKAVSYQVAAIAKVVLQNKNAVAQEESIFQVVVNSANNTASIAALRPLNRSLYIIVGLTWTQCVAVNSDGYEYFAEFENMQ